MRFIIKLSLVCFWVFNFFIIGNAQEKMITKGMIISKSVRIKNATYKIDAYDNLGQSVIIIDGNNITVDFNNAILKGSNAQKKPDEFFGVAIMVINCKNITIKNLSARGYKVALLARNVEGLILDNCDFSYNYRQHLNSTQEKEDISDWMSYHHNENDEWLRYGAAMYLRGCDNTTIKNCKVTDGQNALMMMECNNGMICNNDFSFNSGIGIGMYRSSNNKVIYNRIIFNVRGYCDGVYNRGQDSAGILVYEQSNNNLFYKNAVTHSGDGFFLWAGQTTMDSGKGGCNDNLIYGNDFSYAPTNGIEVTFSRNRIMQNVINECDNGIWGGYSYESVIRNNSFTGNRTAIAIEHGKNNHILMNNFIRNLDGIKLWANKIEPSDWGYPKKRDTRSWDYEITNNVFYKNGKTFNFSNTDSITLTQNFLERDETSSLLKDSTLTHWGAFYNNDSTARPFLESDMIRWPDSILKAGKPLIIPDTTYKGKKNILITEWGPYDFRSPIIWNTNPTDTSAVMKFDLLGPKGKWKIKSFKGVENISSMNGVFPASITAVKTKNDRTDILIELEYIGSAITTPLGQNISGGKSYLFSFKKFFLPIDWKVQWFALDTTVFNPIKANQLFQKNGKPKPIKSEKITKLDYAWWGGIKGDNGIQCPQFITTAEGYANIPNGNYEIGVTWDDAVRVYIDDKLVIDEWNPSKYTFDESPHKIIRLKLGGNHRFRVEHIELGGFATLSLKLKPVN